eukprot:6487646-Amphidinium_carterae.3
MISWPMQWHMFRGTLCEVHAEVLELSDSVQECIQHLHVTANSVSMKVIPVLNDLTLQFQSFG